MVAIGVVLGVTRNIMTMKGMIAKMPHFQKWRGLGRNGMQARGGNGDAFAVPLTCRARHIASFRYFVVATNKRVGTALAMYALNSFECRALGLVAGGGLEPPTCRL